MLRHCTESRNVLPGPNISFPILSPSLSTYRHVSLRMRSEGEYTSCSWKPLRLGQCFMPWQSTHGTVSEYVPLRLRPEKDSTE